MMDRIELLAPAKDLSCGITAIDCGADAVYIGASRYSAREAAGNELDDIAELIYYAHKYWARVYATVNTLLYNREISPALNLIEKLYEIGIDGLIIQDTGLLECDLPPIPLIASTQMHNNTPEKVAFLEKVGFKRAILARELDIEEIKRVRSATNIELECFIHGALCVSYSGQCYLSYALGGRSGNRGQCAQPCRKKYTLFNSIDKPVVKNKHLLSLRDLNLTDHLKELIQAGICSFKIEGRLKDGVYVANVVSHYRNELDRVITELGLKKSSSGTSWIDFQPDVSKTYNRGFTNYYLHGRQEPTGSIDTPKMVGEVIGKAITTAKSNFIINSLVIPHNGDGLCFFDKSGELRGSVINDVRGNVITPDNMKYIENGTVIYRNHDHKFISSIKNSRNKRSIKVKLTLEETADGFLLSAVDEDDNKAEYTFRCEQILAEKSDQALENIKTQLVKYGGTEFQCVNISIKLTNAWFLSISAVNRMRRGVLDKLSAVRKRNRPKETGGAIKNDIPYPETELTYQGNVLNRKAEAFYRRHGVKKIEPAAESGLDLTGRKVMTTRYCIKHQLGFCPKDSTIQKLSETFYLMNDEGDKLRLEFDCAACRMEVFLLKAGS